MENQKTFCNLCKRKHGMQMIYELHHRLTSNGLFFCTFFYCFIALAIVLPIGLNLIDRHLHHDKKRK